MSEQVFSPQIKIGYNQLANLYFLVRGGLGAMRIWPVGQRSGEAREEDLGEVAYRTFSRCRRLLRSGIAARLGTDERTQGMADT